MCIRLVKSAEWSTYQFYASMQSARYSSGQVLCEWVPSTGALPDIIQMCMHCRDKYRLASPTGMSACIWLDGQVMWPWETLVEHMITRKPTSRQLVKAYWSWVFWHIIYINYPNFQKRMINTKSEYDMANIHRKNHKQNEVQICHYFSLYTAVPISNGRGMLC